MRVFLFILMGAYFGLCACTTSPTTDSADGDIPQNDRLDAQVAADCAADGLEDFLDVTRRYLAIAEKIDAPWRSLIPGFAVDTATGDFGFPVDLDEDLIPGRLDGVILSSSDISDGLQQHEAFGGRWTITEGSEELAHGAFGLHQLGLTEIRLTLTNMTDPADGRVYAEPTFELPGQCGSFEVGELQIIVEDLVTTGSAIPIDRDLEDITLGFSGTVVGSPGTLEVWCYRTAGTNVATGTAQFRGKTYDVTVDLATFMVSIGEEIS